jgi:hypothetical protein
MSKLKNNDKCVKVLYLEKNKFIMKDINEDVTKWIRDE